MVLRRSYPGHERFYPFSSQMQGYVTNELQKGGYQPRKRGSWKEASPPSFADHTHQVPQLFLNLFLLAHRLGKLGPQQFPVATAQAVNGDAHGSLRYAKTLTNRSVSSQLPLTGKQ